MSQEEHKHQTNGLAKRLIGEVPRARQGTVHLGCLVKIPECLVVDQNFGLRKEQLVSDNNLEDT